MNIKGMAVLAAFCCLPVAAQAKPVDLQLTGVGNPQVNIGDTYSYQLTARNVGNSRARNVKIHIDLPAEGTLVQASNECTQSGVQLTCRLGNLRKNRQHSVSILYGAPLTATTLDLTASVAARQTDSYPNNNMLSFSTAVVDPYTPPPPPVAVNIVPTVDLDYRVCVGSGGGLTWDDCTPSSLIGHVVSLEPLGVMDTNDPGYTGSWVQPTAETIEVKFFDGFNTLVGIFVGSGVSANCFEGTSSYPTNPAYAGAFRACLGTFVD